jgi:hypothetical protein
MVRSTQQSLLEPKNTMFRGDGMESKLVIHMYTTATEMEAHLNGEICFGWTKENRPLGATHHIEVKFCNIYMENTFLKDGYYAVKQMKEWV